MEFISALGSVPVALAFVLIVTFALNFRKGIVLINIMAWTAMLIFIAKQTIDFPRPADGDSAITTDDHNNVNTQLKNQQPTSFTGLFSEEVLTVTRADQEVNSGFPSGHTSLQVALWLGMLFLLRKRWVLSTGISIMLLIMLSRLYLGHHFFGDILGGLTLRIITLGLLGLLIIQSKFFKQLRPDFKSITVLWLPLLIIPFIEYVEVWLLGSLLGINLTAALIILKGNTLLFSKKTAKRIGSSFILILCTYLLYYIGGAINFGNNLILSLIAIIALSFALYTGIALILKRINFFQYKV